MKWNLYSQRVMFKEPWVGVMVREVDQKTKEWFERQDPSDYQAGDGKRKIYMKAPLFTAFSLSFLESKVDDNY